MFALFRVATALPNAFGAQILKISGFEWANGVSLFIKCTHMLLWCHILHQ